MKRGKKRERRYDPRLERGLKDVRHGKSVGTAATSIGETPGRLRRYIGQAVSARRVRGRWLLRDSRLREVKLYSVGHFITIVVRGFSRSSLVLRYMVAAARFIDTNDISHLRRFVGKGVEDMNGRWVPFEVRPNQLYRLHAIVRHPFEEIYRIIV